VKTKPRKFFTNAEEKPELKINEKELGFTFHLTLRQLSEMILRFISLQEEKNVRVSILGTVFHYFTIISL
jgi:hypothetical protein